MAKSYWEFKSLVRHSDSRTEVIELKPELLGRVGFYTRALEKAKKSSMANPQFSLYFVKESIGSEGRFLPAGNIEYGFCSALHGEETAIAAFVSHYGSSRGKLKNVVLGIIAGNPGNVASPCGNCRDIMLETLGSDFEIVSGAAEGGIAVVSSMSDYMFSDFSSVALKTILVLLKENILATTTEGEKLMNDAYGPLDIHPERRYHVCIITAMGKYFGARDVFSEYHPIYALHDAVRQARRVKDPFMRHVIIVREDPADVPPHVMYKDRQHLYELNLQAELLSGKNQDPPVYLVSVKRDFEISGIWRTSVKEWLPLPFGPHNFGNDFMRHLADYYHKKHMN